MRKKTQSVIIVVIVAFLCCALYIGQPIAEKCFGEGRLVDLVIIGSLLLVVVSVAYLMGLIRK